jgi:hypothetical protein
MLQQYYSDGFSLLCDLVDERKGKIFCGSPSSVGH